MARTEGNRLDMDQEQAGVIGGNSQISYLRMFCLSLISGLGYICGCIIFACFSHIYFAHETLSMDFILQLVPYLFLDTYLITSFIVTFFISLTRRFDKLNIVVLVLLFLVPILLILPLKYWSVANISLIYETPFFTDGHVRDNIVLIFLNFLFITYTFLLFVSFDYIVSNYFKQKVNHSSWSLRQKHLQVLLILVVTVLLLVGDLISNALYFGFAFTSTNIENWLIQLGGFVDTALLIGFVYLGMHKGQSGFYFQRPLDGLRSMMISCISWVLLWIFLVLVSASALILFSPVGFAIFITILGIIIFVDCLKLMTVMSLLIYLTISLLAIVLFFLVQSVGYNDYGLYLRRTDILIFFPMMAVSLIFLWSLAGGVQIGLHHVFKRSSNQYQVENHPFNKSMFAKLFFFLR